MSALRCIPLVLSALLVGCATHGGLTTAHGVGKGNLQGAVEPGVGMVAGDGGSVIYPNLNLAMRYGVSDKVDIGGRIGTTSYEVIGKYVFTDGGTDQLVVSVAPSATFWAFSFGGAGGGFFAYQLPVLFGIPTGESQLVVGPKLKHVVGLASGGDASSSGSVIFGGAVVGYSAKLGDKFRLHPEVAVDVPLIAGASASAGGDSVGGSTSVGGAALVGVNLGLLFGGN